MAKKKYSVKTDPMELYTEVYLPEEQKIISRFYKKFGKIGDAAPQITGKLNFEQFKKELKYIREQNPSDYGNKFVEHIRNLVSSDVKYSMRQNRAVWNNLNEYIRTAWLMAANRSSSQGRYKENWSLSVESAGIYSSLINYIISVKGQQAKLKDCLLELSEVVGQSPYFQNIYDIVNIDILGGNASELYAS